jgi:ribonucleoside-triphosphate reductase
MENKITKVQKRDGRIVDFDFDRIINGIFKAITATGQGDEAKAKKIADDVLKLFKRRFKNNGVPGVEQIQDIIE